MERLLTVAEVEQRLAAGPGLAGCVVKGLDLHALDAAVATQPLDGAAFLGCRLGVATLDAAQDAGALVFPPIDGVPFDAYRLALYTPDELYQGFDRDDPSSYGRSLDARIDAWARAHSDGDVVGAIAQRLHDFAVSSALSRLIDARPVAGIMGGHKIRRDEPWYEAVAHLGRRLHRAGMLVLTGGGPGAMEAGNLGAFCAPHPDAVLDDALTVLRAAPDFHERDRWLAAGLAVRARWLAGSGESVGIPTWHYGHEPPTPFASHIGKYFQNSVREDGIVTVAAAGIVFTPGGAGTVQEMFQDASQNAYEQPGRACPMVLFGVDYWTRVLSAHALLLQVAKGTALEGLVHLTDDLDEVVAVLSAHAGR